MPLAIRAGSLVPFSSTPGSGTSIQGTWPTGAVAGDTVAFIVDTQATFSNNDPIIAPSPLVIVNTVINQQNAILAIMVVTSGELAGAAPTFTWNFSRNCNIASFSITGGPSSVSGYTITANDNQTQNTGSVAVNAMTVPNPNSMLIRHGWYNKDSTADGATFGGWATDTSFTDLSKVVPAGNTLASVLSYWIQTTATNLHNDTDTLSIVDATKYTAAFNVALYVPPPSPPAAAALYSTGSGQIWSLGAALAAPSSVSPFIKWHPGHYYLSNELVTTGNNAWANRKAEIDTGLVNANVLGYMDIHIANTIENATLGSYNWANIDQAYNYIITTYPGKRYGVMIWWEVFTGSNPASAVPAYILNSPGTYGAGANGTQGGYWTLTSGVTAAWWRPAVAARIQAMFAALAAHVGQGGTLPLDQDPLFEMVTFQESSMPVTSGSDYSDSAAAVQWGNIHNPANNGFTHTNIIAQANDTHTQSAMQTFMANTEHECAFGGPDMLGVATFPYTFAQNVYVGNIWNGSAWVAGGTDLRGKMPHLGLVESPDFQAYTAQDIANNALNNFRCSHLLWEPSGAGNGTWAAILAVINSNPVPSLNQQCPSFYLGCNTS